MSTRFAPLLAFALLALVHGSAYAAPADAEADRLVEKSEQQTRGTSFEGKLSMSVVKNQDERKLDFMIWSIGRDEATIKILGPARDRGTANLRIKLNLWQYLPNLDRTIKIPPSMMLQSWMGSDFTNDDLVKTSSLSRDYTHRVLSKEKLQAQDAIKIECLPKPTAPVAWGKVILWVTPGDAVPIRQEFYTEKGRLVKVMEGTDIRTFGTHKIPATLTMHTLSRPSDSTTLHYESATYDKPVSPNTFTQEFMRKEAR
jgi:hypothetical protein